MGGDVHDVGRGSFHSRRPSLDGWYMPVSDPREYGTLGVGRHDNPALSAFRWRGPGSHQPTPLRARHPRLAKITLPNRDMPTKWIHPLVLKNTEAGSMRCAGVRPQTELPLAPGPAGDCARFERGWWAGTKSPAPAAPAARSRTVAPADWGMARGVPRRHKGEGPTSYFLLTSGAACSLSLKDQLTEHQCSVP